MILKDIKDEDFVNYKVPSMFIATSKCDWKCPKEANCDISICQNSAIATQRNIDIQTDDICSRYASNDITKAIVFGGLEPMLQIDDLLDIIKLLRVKYSCDDDVVIYTGYYKHEIESELSKLKQFKNIIIKYGRYVPNDQPRYDSLLGVTLASKNQYGEKIS